MEENNQQQFTEAYVNSLGVQLNAYEFALQFGVTDLHDLESIRHVVTLRMSPQHAKSIVLLLQRFVTIYEEQTGPINLPKELTQSLTGNEGDDQNDQN